MILSYHYEVSQMWSPFSPITGLLHPCLKSHLKSYILPVRRVKNKGSLIWCLDFLKQVCGCIGECIGNRNENNICELATRCKCCVPWQCIVALLDLMFFCRVSLLSITNKSYSNMFTTIRWSWGKKTWQGKSKSKIILGE